MPSLDASKSLESDSAIFEDDHDSKQNLKISNLNLPLENVSATQSLENLNKVNKIYLIIIIKDIYKINILCVLVCSSTFTRKFK